MTGCCLDQRQQHLGHYFYTLRVHLHPGTCQPRFFFHFLRGARGRRHTGRVERRRRSRLHWAPGKPAHRDTGDKDRLKINHAEPRIQAGGCGGVLAHFRLILRNRSECATPRLSDTRVIMLLVNVTHSPSAAGQHTLEIKYIFVLTDYCS